jgi:hypothetical protein
MAETTQNAPLAEEEFAASNGIEWSTGLPLSQLTAADLNIAQNAPKAVTDRGNQPEAFLADPEVDPNNLEQAGWGVIFAPNTPDAVKQALEPLLARRESQAKRLFKRFEGRQAPTNGELVRDWLERRNVTFATVDPENGVPLYLLLVASPDAISFEFQYLLDTYWNVGRLHFDTFEDYRAYAENVAAYERETGVPHRKRVTVFAPRNNADRATAFFHNQVAQPLTTGLRPLGQNQGFQLRSVLADNATKEELADILNGKRPGGLPALLLTGSHGAYAGTEDPKQAERIGALVTQDWPGLGNSMKEDYCFGAFDFGADERIYGLVHFFYACYGGGCPKFDTYSKSRKLIAPEPLVSRLPQTMLRRGALASIAHIDRAFATSFQTSRQQPQVQDIRGVLVQIMQGQRVGQAMDAFNVRWSVLAAELSELQRKNDIDQSSISESTLNNCWLARDDARNYAVFGDPAVRLRVDTMES